MQSTVLNVFPSQSDDQRLVLAREVSAQGRSQLVLLQESRSKHVGWFTQSRIVIEPDQAAALKMTLTSNLVMQNAAINDSACHDQPRHDEPVEILSFRSAMAG